MIGGLIRFSLILFVLYSCFAVILYPEGREYTLAQLPEKLEGHVCIEHVCSGNVTLIYDGREILRKSMYFDTGMLVTYSTLLNFSIPKEVGNHTIEIISECFPTERVDYSVTNRIPVILSYNTNKLMVGDEFRLQVFGDHVTIYFNNETYHTSVFNHIFWNPGNYSILVKVRDDFGDTGEKSIPIIVSDTYFFNYSFNSTVLPGKKLMITYVLRDFFGRDRSDEVEVFVFRRKYHGNGSVIINVPDFISPGNYTITFTYKNRSVNATIFVPKVVRFFDLELDKTMLTRDEPVYATITVLDQTGTKMHVICGLSICGKNCTNVSVPSNTQLALTSLYWEPGFYTILASYENHTSTEYLFVPEIHNLSYNYSTSGNITSITLRNTGNTLFNTTVIYCSGGTCTTFNISLEKNGTRTISLKNPETISLKYANKTISLPVTGSFTSFFNLWFIWISLSAVFIVLLVTVRRKSKGK